MRVESSVIREIEYDDASATLVVTFARGDVYAYFLVPRSVYERFLAAPSKGRFFNALILPFYGARRRRPPDDAVPALPRSRPPGLGSGPGGLLPAAARPEPARAAADAVEGATVIPFPQGAV